jgi:hypothetical protein
MAPCSFRDTPFQMSHHIYRGKHIARYQISVCEGCYAGNWDGWAPHYKALIVRHLEANGLPISGEKREGMASTKPGRAA